MRAGQFLSFAADSHVRLPLEMERLLSVHKSSHTRDTMTRKCTLRWLLFFPDEASVTAYPVNSAFIQIRKFLNPLSRVDIFEYAMNPE